VEVGRLSFDVRLHSLLFQFLVQFGEGIFEQLAVSWILAGGQFLKNSLAREAEVLFFPPAGSFFGAHLRTGVGRLISGLGLLSFDGFAFPPSGHVALIIVLTGLNIAHDGTDHILTPTCDFFARREVSGSRNGSELGLSAFDFGGTIADCASVQGSPFEGEASCGGVVH